MKRFFRCGLALLLLGNATRADVRRDDFQIESDLLSAAMQGDSLRVRDLLDKGAKIETRDAQNTWTPLMWAARGGHVATVRLLLERGARVNARSVGSARTYLSLAPGHTRTTTINTSAGPMTQSAAMSYFLSSNNGITPLMLAAVGGYNLAAKELLKRGANANARSSSGESALEAAAFKGYLPLVETLIARGAQVNARNGKGETALLAAISEGHTAVVRDLLAHGAAPNVATGNGYSALSLARYYEYPDIERALRRAGATAKVAPFKAALPNLQTPKTAKAPTPTTKPGAPAASGSGIIILN